MTQVGVVIVNYFSAGLIEELLTCCPWLHTVPMIVVDNSVDPDEDRRLRRALDRLDQAVLVTSERNDGFGIAANRGARRLSRFDVDHVLFLNPDARISENDVATLLGAAALDPQALLSPVIEKTGGDIWFCGGVLDWTRGVAAHAPSVPPEWLTAACLLAPRRRFESLGGFPSGNFMYWEDVDLSHRWRAAGGSLRVVPEARAQHLVGATQGSAPGKSSLYLRWNCTNRLRFARHHLGGRARLSWIVHTPRYAVRMRRRSRPDSCRGQVVAGLALVRGSLHGLALHLLPRRWCA